MAIALFLCFIQEEAIAGVPVKSTTVKKVFKRNNTTCEIIVDRPVCSNAALRASIERVLLGYIKDNSADYNVSIPTAKNRSFSTIIQIMGNSILKKFIADYDKDNDPFDRGQFYNIEIKLVADTKEYVSYSINEQLFTGGEHGMYHTRHVTIRKSDGKPLTNILQREKESQMQPLLKKVAAEQGDLEEYLKYLKHLEREDIPLPEEDAWLQPDGVHIQYQPYEICTWVMGMPEFVIPAKDAQPFISKEASLLLKSR